ncbi:unnamed protein product, partial [Amoebophrya sp. A25]
TAAAGRVSPAKMAALTALSSPTTKRVGLGRGSSTFSSTSEEPELELHSPRPKKLFDKNISSISSLSATARAESVQLARERRARQRGRIVASSPPPGAALSQKISAAAMSSTSEDSSELEWAPIEIKQLRRTMTKALEEVRQMSILGKTPAEKRLHRANTARDARERRDRLRGRMVQQISVKRTSKDELERDSSKESTVASTDEDLQQKNQGRDYDDVHAHTVAVLQDTEAVLSEAAKKLSAKERETLLNPGQEKVLHEWARKSALEAERILEEKALLAQATPEERPKKSRLSTVRMSDFLRDISGSEEEEAPVAVDVEELLDDENAEEVPHVPEDQKTDFNQVAGTVLTEYRVERYDEKDGMCLVNVADPTDVVEVACSLHYDEGLIPEDLELDKQAGATRKASSKA